MHAAANALTLAYTLPGMYVTPSCAVLLLSLLLLLLLLLLLYQVRGCCCCSAGASLAVLFQWKPNRHRNKTLSWAQAVPLAAHEALAHESA